METKQHFINWQHWKQYYRQEIAHDYGYEEKFVDLVLSQVPNLEPDDVIAQYHFKDSNNKNRYIDFMIINKTKGYNLAIELDGLTKLQDHTGNLDYASYQDLWFRQNDLMRSVGGLLRFTNQQMKYQTQWVIDSISSTLVDQSQHRLVSSQTLKNYEQTIRQLQAVIDQSKQEQADRFVMPPLPSLAEIQAKNQAEIQAKTEQAARAEKAAPPKDQADDDSKMPVFPNAWRWSAGFGILAVILGYTVFPSYKPAAVSDQADSYHSPTDQTNDEITAQTQAQYIPITTPVSRVDSDQEPQNAVSTGQIKAVKSTANSHQDSPRPPKETATNDSSISHNDQDFIGDNPLVDQVSPHTKEDSRQVVSGLHHQAIMEHISQTQPTQQPKTNLANQVSPNQTATNPQTALPASQLPNLHDSHRLTTDRGSRTAITEDRADRDTGDLDD